MADDCFSRIRSRENSLTKSYGMIAEKILKAPETIVRLSVDQMAKICSVSEASVVRFCQFLGYEGFSDLKINLSAETSRHDTIFSDLQDADDDATILKKVFSAEIRALHKTLSTIDVDSFKKAVDSITAANKIEFYAYGNSCPVVADAHYRMLKIGINSYVGIDWADSLMHASMLTVQDVAIAVSHTGETYHTCRAMQLAKERGAVTICITGFPESRILQYADIKIITDNDNATVFQTTTVASRTAQVAVMDSLYTAVAFRKAEQSKQRIEYTNKILAPYKH